ncbi:MAG: hypothetical protein OXH11_05035 [Candidatus Aminicenantes bacterium]|nr:hypothetical protein [Candidatus Aminicenantes bacterium]
MDTSARIARFMAEAPGGPLRGERFRGFPCHGSWSRHSRRPMPRECRSINMRSKRPQPLNVPPDDK